MSGGYHAGDKLASTELLHLDSPTSSQVRPQPEGSCTSLLAPSYFLLSCLQMPFLLSSSPPSSPPPPPSLLPLLPPQGTWREVSPLPSPRYYPRATGAPPPPLLLLPPFSPSSPSSSSSSSSPPGLSGVVYLTGGGGDGRDLDEVSSPAPHLTSRCWHSTLRLRPGWRPATSLCPGSNFILI